MKRSLLDREQYCARHKTRKGGTDDTDSFLELTLLDRRRGLSRCRGHHWLYGPIGRLPGRGCGLFYAGLGLSLWRGGIINPRRILLKGDTMFRYTVFAYALGYPHCWHALALGRSVGLYLSPYPWWLYWRTRVFRI